MAKVKAKYDAEETLRRKTVNIVDPQVMRHYVDDLRDLLARSSTTEQKSFLKSFLERSEVGDLEVKMYYTVPMPPHTLSEETVGLLPSVHHG